MKNKIIGILFFITTLSPTIDAQYFPVDTAKLNSSYRELVNKPNTLVRQKNFFDAFPSTWMEFTMTYQFLPYSDYDLTMYHLGYNHVRALGERVTLIKDSLYCNKLVRLAIGGTWFADAPNYLKSLLHQMMWKRMEGMLKVISGLRKGNQFQFWLFYWSNLVDSKVLKTEFERLLKLNADVYPEEMKIMSVAFEYFYDGITIPEDYVSRK
ncbi:MAG: hypothetical protein QM654_14635 [Dysgonamonadaceae bacterium]